MARKFSPHIGLFEELSEGKHSSTLGDKFLLPPFTVLNAREGWWQDRKRAWLELGIKSELGRGEDTAGDALLFSTSAQNRLTEIMAQKKSLRSNTMSSSNAMQYTGGFEDGAAGTSGTSIFDPILCELAYRWFSPPGGMVLDPFAGGSVRGIVASKLGRRYVGIDLSARQIEANCVQATELCTADDPIPSWIVGDSRDIETLVTEQADFIWTCPPYADLEVYSDDPKDLSQLGYAEFAKVYATIIKSTCAKLKPDRFAGIVVGDVRGKDGCYYGFPWDTVAAFKAAGLRLHNEAVLVTAVGSLPIRAGRQFSAGRKLGKTHQNLFVFVKGDPKKASEACGVFEE